MKVNPNHLRDVFANLALSVGMVKIESWSSKELMDKKAPFDRTIWQETANGQVDALAELIVREVVQTAKECGASKTIMTKLITAAQEKYDVTIPE